MKHRVTSVFPTNCPGPLLKLLQFAERSQPWDFSRPAQFRLCKCGAAPTPPTACLVTSRSSREYAERYYQGFVEWSRVDSGQCTTDWSIDDKSHVLHARLCGVGISL